MRGLSCSEPRHGMSLGAPAAVVAQAVASTGSNESDSSAAHAASSAALAAVAARSGGAAGLTAPNAATGRAAGAAAPEPAGAVVDVAIRGCHACVWTYALCVGSPTGIEEREAFAFAFRCAESDIAQFVGARDRTGQSIA